MQYNASCNMHMWISSGHSLIKVFKTLTYIVLLPNYFQSSANLPKLFCKEMLRGVRWQSGLWGGSVRGEQRSQGQRQGKPDFGTVRLETQYVGYTGDDRRVYWIYIQALTAQIVG